VRRVVRALRLIRQRTDSDCGVCVAAMLAGVSYREARGAAERLGLAWRTGLWAHELKRLLLSLTGRPWWGGPFRLRRRLSDFNGTPAAALVASPKGRQLHWLVWHAGHVYDPAEDDGPQRPGVARVRRWKLKRLLRQLVG
jgi:hypothetical protein